MTRRPKTLRAFLKTISILEAVPLEDLKGYQKLNDTEKGLLGELVGEIANSINDTPFKGILEKMNLIDSPTK